MRKSSTGIGFILLLALGVREVQAEEPSRFWLVQFRTPVTRVEPILEHLRSLLSLQVFGEHLPLPHTFSLGFTLPVAAARIRPILEGIAPIAVLERNHTWKPFRTPNDPFYSLQWGLKNTGQILPYFPDPADNNGGENDPGTTGMDAGAEAAWDLTTGTPELRIGVLDTGVDPQHPDLMNRLYRNPGEIRNGVDDDGNGYRDDLWGWDLCEGDGEPYDLDGHGTAVASTILAPGNDGTGIAGVMWEGTIVPVRFLGPLFETGANPNQPDCNLTSGAIKGLEYLKKAGVRVVNMSWGGEEDSTLLKQKLEELANAGIVLVAASGNEGVNLSQKPFYPAAYSIPGLITVGAHTNEGKVASFSNYGSPVKLYAPGANIRASAPALEDLWSYADFNGTSSPNGVEALPPGRITGTHFQVAGTKPQFGKARLTRGDIVIVGDEKAVNNYANNRQPQGYSSGLDGILLSDPVNLSAYGSGVLRYTLFYEFDATASLVLEYSLNGPSGPWLRLPGGAGVYGDTQGKAKVAEELFDLGAALGYLPSALSLRFRFTTTGQKDTITQVPGGFWLLGVAWLRPGNRYDGSQGPPYNWYSGTSLAAPFVSGGAGLLLAKEPGLSPPQVTQRLSLYTASLNDSRNPDARRLFLPAALQGGVVVSSDGNSGNEFGAFPGVVTLGEPVMFRIKILGAPPPVEAIAYWGMTTLTGTPLLPGTTPDTYSAIVTPEASGTYRYSFKIRANGEEVHGPFEEERTFVVLPPPSPANPPQGCGCNLAPQGIMPGELFALLFYLLIFLFLRTHGKRFP